MGICAYLLAALRYFSGDTSMSVTSPDNRANNPSNPLPDQSEVETISTEKMAAAISNEDGEIAPAETPASTPDDTDEAPASADEVDQAATADMPANAPDDVDEAPTGEMPTSNSGNIDEAPTVEMPATVAGESDEASTASIPALSPEKVKKRKRRPYSKRRRIITLAVLAVVLAGVLVPAGFLIAYGVSGYQTYVALKDQAHDGVNHLLNVKTIFTGVKTHPSGFLDVTKLTLARKELDAAQTDFEQLQYKIDHTPIIQTLTSYLPQFIPQVQTARAASRIGVDVTHMGQELISTALYLAPTFRGSLLTNSSKPLVTQEMLNRVGTTISDLLPRLTDIQQQSRLLSLDSLPVSASQRDEFGQLLQLLPQAQSDLEQAQNLLGVSNWLLGIDSPR